MTPEQQLREALKKVDDYYEAQPSVEDEIEVAVAFDDVLTAVGRLLDPIPDEVVAGLIFELGGLDAIVAEKAIQRYRAWLIGGDES